MSPGWPPGPAAPTRATRPWAPSMTPSSLRRSTAPSAPGSGALGTLMAQRGGVFHLLPGEIEHDPVRHVGDGANRDSDFLAPPQVPFLEQHMGHPVVTPVDDDPLHLPDLTIDGMDVFTMAKLCLA